MILSKDGGRMSKRHGATSIFEYKNMGFLPEALVNYLSLMGWAPGNDVEILPVGEIVKLFDIKDVNKTGATFDLDKLSWINGQYIKNMETKELAVRAENFLADKKIIDDKFDKDRWVNITAAYKERTRTLEDFISVYKIFFCDDVEYDEKAVAKYLNKPNSKEIMHRCKSAIEPDDKFDKVSIEESYRKLADELKVKAAELIHPTRVAISGKTVGAGLFDMMELLGREKVLKRLSKFIVDS